MEVSLIHLFDLKDMWDVLEKVKELGVMNLFNGRFHYEKGMDFSNKPIKDSIIRFIAKRIKGRIITSPSVDSEGNFLAISFYKIKEDDFVKKSYIVEFELDSRENLDKYDELHYYISKMVDDDLCVRNFYIREVK